MVLQDVIGVISEIVDMSSDTRFFRFTLDKPLPFRAGQFVNLIFDDNGEKFVRPYSLASSPDTPGVLELCIKLVKTGRATPHLWHKKVGDSLRIKGPSGSFLFKHNGHDKVFIGSGTGVAPLRSMIVDALSHGNNKQFTLILGVRFDHEVLFREEFEQLMVKYKNFVFVPVVSKPSDGWKGKAGHVQDHLDMVTLQNTDFYLCGVPGMVEETTKKLLSLGVPQACIMHEKF